MSERSAASAVARVAFAVTLAFSSARGAHAEPSDAEAQASARRVLIALRVLAYDKALEERTPDEVATVVLLARNADASHVARARWQAGFALLPKVKVGGRPVRVVAIDFEGARSLDTLVAALAPTAMIVMSDLAADVPAIRAASRAHHVLTIADREELVRAGLAVGLVAGHEHDEIVIDVDAARAEGVRFGAGLLQLARIVGAGK